jgi:hypothetical protein
MSRFSSPRSRLTSDIIPENPYDPESSQDPAITTLCKVAHHEEALTALEEVSFEQALM